MRTEAIPAVAVMPPTRQQAVDTFAAEISAFGTLIDGLSGDDWTQPTMCGDWSVRDVVAHAGGQVEELARFPVMIRRLRSAKRRYPERIVLDGHNQVQIDDVAGMPPGGITSRFHRYGPAGVRALRRMPFLVRRMPSDWFFPGSPLREPHLGYLFDVIVTRDAWMHRVEIRRATGRDVTVADHDGTVVDQVIRDLGMSWRGPSVKLELTGDAGGTWTLGDGEPTATVNADAVEMMLHLSGRPSVDIDPDGPVGEARVVF